MDEGMSPMSDASMTAGEILLRLTAAATLAAGAFLVGQGTSQLLSTGSALTYSGGVFQVAGSVPGTPSAGQVLIGGGAIKAGAGISCTTLTASSSIRSTGGSDPSSATSAVHSWVYGGTIPIFDLVASGNALNEKIWEWRNNGGVLQFICVNDAYSATNVAVSFARSGATPGAATFASSVSCTTLTASGRVSGDDLKIGDGATYIGYLTYGGSYFTLNAQTNHGLKFNTNNTLALTIASGGAATFASGISLGGLAYAAGYGAVQCPVGTALAQGISWAQDTFLYRTAAGALKTDGSFTCVTATATQSLAVSASGTSNRQLSLTNTGGTCFVAMDASTSDFGGTGYGLVLYAPSGRVIEQIVAGTGVITRASGSAFTVFGVLDAQGGNIQLNTKSFANITGGNTFNVGAISNSGVRTLNFYANTSSDIATLRASIDVNGLFTCNGGIASSGTVYGGLLRSDTYTPASASAAGVAGFMTWDASYLYVCTATNTWKRVAIATW